MSLKKKNACYLLKDSPPPPPAHGGAWKVAYADFVTAMHGFLPAALAAECDNRRSKAGYFQTISSRRERSRDPAASAALSAVFR